MGRYWFKQGIANIRLLREAVSPSPERAATGSRLTYAIADRLREILPTGDFDLSTDGRIIRIRGLGVCRGNSCSLAPGLLWNLPKPTGERLELIFETYGRDIQRFLTKSLRCPWPEEGAGLHIDISSEIIEVWWGGPDKIDAAVRLRPIERRELGV